MKKFEDFRIQSRILNLVLILVLPVFTLMSLEYFTHVPWDLSVPIFLLNLAFYYLLFAIFTFLFGSTSLGYAIAPVIPMLFGLVNYFVVDFRSAPIVPWDIYSIGTAVSVAGNYEFKINGRLVAVVLSFMLIAFLGSRTGLKVKRWRIRILCLCFALAGMYGYVVGVGSDAVIDVVGLDTTLFTPNVLYRNNGLTAGFLGNLKFLMVEKPDGYSAQKAEDAAQEYRKHTADSKEKLPNVIVIMNEAFSDMSVFGEFEIDYDYMPFIHALSDNTVKGDCYVSVLGGNTANSEYEFLTGDSMAFLPAGSVPYQQYIKGEMPTLTTYLKKLGYQTTAIHPYNASGWARNKVYPWLGFEHTLFRNDFVNPLLIRNYVSDNSAFNKIIELYEEKDEGENFFAFEVTMQNHGGYSKDVEGFEESVHLSELSNKTAQVRAAEKYLTLMLESDRAFEMLVNYFMEQEEDTIILMFGDHQPSDYITNIFLRLQGLNREDSDVFFDNYIVPFVMWANYDIEEEHVDAISVNYLSGLLFEKAGMPLNGYQTFLQDLRKDIPAFTANMVMTADGKRYSYEEGKALSEEQLHTYHMLMYNHLSDTDGRLEDFFD